MKKLFLIVLSFFVLLPVSALAIDLGKDLTKDTATKAGYANTTETGLSETIGTVVNAALSLIGVIFTALMVYAGFKWMTAQGEESKVDDAKKIITASIIGLIITLGAYSITNFVIPRILERTTGEVSDSNG